MDVLRKVRDGRFRSGRTNSSRCVPLRVVLRTVPLHAVSSVMKVSVRHHSATAQARRRKNMRRG